LNLETGHLVGPIAGLATSFLWVLTSLVFTAGGRRIGSTKVNTFRLIVAVPLHAITFWIAASAAGAPAWFPPVTSEQLIYLALSGFVGLTICDQALFTAFVDIGPRRSLLIMTTAPLFASLFGVAVLGEPLMPVEIAGIGVTVGGVAWVVSERSAPGAGEEHAEHFKRGVILAFVAAASQAGGTMLSKLGMSPQSGAGAIAIDPQAATFVRMIFGLVGMAPILVAYAMRRGSDAHLKAKSRRRGSPGAGYAFTVLGAIVGPFLGVWMSLVAINETPSLGVAQTLISLSPVMILPFAVWLHKEKLSYRAVLGAVIALAGTALLALFAGGEQSPAAIDGPVPATGAEADVL